ncbi:nucleoporin Nup192p [[Candida] jaroonii]|uniref:Nucleoporin Nup192p n=1 Tax=[Candida] jaroonii TaxID=467808 RepID=A0ACA9Y076_9ASCO|nr:nucleoporin Nup192p [[Candida] jaroonii]
MVNWSNDLLIDCYDSIYFDQRVDESLLRSIKEELTSMFKYPKKDPNTKNQMIENKSPVEFSNGDKFKLNQQFIESSILLSNELDLNELHTAEILYHGNKSNIDGVDFVDTGKQYYFKRFEYALNILGYLITNKKLNLIVTDYNELLTNLIESFNNIYRILNNLEDLVNKMNVTNSWNESSLNSILYTKQELFQLHELLGQIYYNLIENYFDKFNLASFNTMITHIKSNISDDDLLIVHYLPGILNFVNKFEKLPESDIISLHKQITTSLNEDFKLVSINDDIIDLTNSKLKSFEVLIDFIILTNLVNWCKNTKNYEKFDFDNDFLKYFQICLNYGVFENLLRFTSETSNDETIKYFEINNLCDFKFNLQKNFPNLKLIKFHSEKLQLKISKVFKDDLLPIYWHYFFKNFIDNVAIILTQLRDNEEDFLLSSINKQKKSKEIQDNNDKSLIGINSIEVSEDNFEIDFEEIYLRSDLERFYLSFVYTYNFRPVIGDLIWGNDEINNDLIGFIMWGVNNNSSPLITATFCLLLSSLTTNGDNSSNKIFEILINNNSIKKIDYSKISIDSIYESLNYYLDSLNDNLETDSTMSKSLLNDQLKKFNEILIELSNDSMIFINGFLNLITSIISNLNDNFERSKEIKINLFNRFKPIIIGFLKFDNLIINSKLKSNSNTIILINETNRIQLINLIFNFLKSFNEPTLNLEIWKILDNWMFHNYIDDEKISTSSKIKFTKNNITIKNAFKINLIDLTNILNFTDLIQSLLLKKSVDFTRIQYELLYPKDLGFNYRLNNEIGIWPYLEFIIVEVFQNSNKVVDNDIKHHLQGTLIEIFQHSIDQIDWEFLIDTLPTITEFDNNSLIKEETFNTFIKLHQSISILNYLYDEKSLKVIFQIIEDEKPNLSNSLNLLETLINLQEIFRKLLPIVKSSSPLNVYYPKNFNSPNVFELINFNNEIITKLGLLINHNDDEVVEKSMDLLNTINNDSNLNENKLFTIYINSPDSLNLKYSMINQFLNGDIKIKFKILNFIIKDLAKNGKQPCISHFILGYKIQGNYLILEDKNLLKNLLDLLISTLDSISTIDYNNGINIIDYNSVKVSSLILNIIIKLSENPVSSTILSFIRNNEINLFEKLMTTQSKINLQTIWNEENFNGNLLTTNSFTDSKISTKTFFQFFNYRILVLKFLTIEFHNLSQNKAIYLKNQYLDFLLNENNFLNNNYKILNFLDLLNFKFTHFERFNYQKFPKFNINSVLNEIISDGERSDDFFNNTIIVKLNNFGIETNELSKFMEDFINFENLKKFQLSYLHNWVQLIEVIINDGNLSPKNYQNFILEILSNILPKINEFFETDDIIFSEELISLCVLLFNNYFETNNEEIFIERLLILLSTTVKGIKSLNSTIKLRNDLYILLNNFLIKILKIDNKNLLMKVIDIFKKIDLNFLDILINDLIVNENSIKVISIILLENLIHLFNKFDDNYLINKLINNNSLLLIVRLIKRIDEILEFDDNINNLSSILYELTIFKSILNLLIRISTIRQGSSYLIQSELFSIIKNCKIFQIDFDLNINFKFNNINKFNNEDIIDYYEILIPIFKLFSILLISMGPNYKPSKIQGNDLLNHFSKLKNNIVKKDILVNENKLVVNDSEMKNLDKLINQFILLESLVN